MAWICVNTTDVEPFNRLSQSHGAHCVLRAGCVARMEFLACEHLNSRRARRRSHRLRHVFYRQRNLAPAGSLACHHAGTATDSQAELAYPFSPDAGALRLLLCLSALADLCLALLRLQLERYCQ